MVADVPPVDPLFNDIRVQSEVDPGVINDSPSSQHLKIMTTLLSHTHVKQSQGRYEHLLE